jgi:hypothetical protein
MITFGGRGQTKRTGRDRRNVCLSSGSVNVGSKIYADHITRRQTTGKLPSVPRFVVQHRADLRVVEDRSVVCRFPV